MYMRNLQEIYQFYNMIPRTFSPIKYINRYDQGYWINNTFYYKDSRIREVSNAKKIIRLLNIKENDRQIRR